MFSLRLALLFNSCFDMPAETCPIGSERACPSSRSLVVYMPDNSADQPY